MWEEILLNILSIVIGVFVGTWFGTELMTRRMSKTVSKILKKVLDDGEAKKALEKTAQEFVSYIIKAAKEQFYSGESEEETEVISLPKPSTFKEGEKENG